MNWERMLVRQGWLQQETGTYYDPFDLLAKQAKDKGLPYATLSFRMGSSLPYGESKCEVSVTIHCSQDERSINLAAETAFRKAIELVNDGASHVGVPLLQSPPE